MSPVADPSLPTIDVGSTTGAFCPDLWAYYNLIYFFISLMIKNNFETFKNIYIGSLNIFLQNEMIEFKSYLYEKKKISLLPKLNTI